MSGDRDEMKAFRELQAHLAPRWALADGDGPEPRDIVVVPSLSFDGIDSVAIDGVIHYEERMLFTLNLLRHPQARLIYMSSAAIHPAAVDYMLSLIRGIPTEQLRQRLTVLSLYDSSPVPLSKKILERPRVIERIPASCILKVYRHCLFQFWYDNSVLTIRTLRPLTSVFTGNMDRTGISLSRGRRLING